jgi:hypothetical protein
LASPTSRAPPTFNPSFIDYNQELKREIPNDSPFFSAPFGDLFGFFEKHLKNP